MIERFSLSVFLTTLFTLPWLRGGELLQEGMLFNLIIFTLVAINAIAAPDKIIQLLQTHKSVFSICILFLVYVWVHPASVAPDEAKIEATKITAYFAVFLLTLLLINTKQRADKLTLTLILCATLMACYSLLNHFTNGQYELFAAIPPFGTSWDEAVRGTFSYKNHYASYTAMALLMSTLYTFHCYDKKKKLLTNLNTPSVLIGGLSIVLLFFTLINTASRGALLAFTIVIVFYMLVKLFCTRGPFALKSVALAIALLLAGLILFMQSSTYERVKKHGWNPSGRDIAQLTAKELITENSFILGSGLGSYPLLQHKYKHPDLRTTPMWKRAHNDYLEYFTSAGLVGLLLFSAFVSSVGITALLNRKKRNNKVKNNFQSIYCAVILYLAIHCLLDFNLAIPAIFVLLMISLSIVLNKTPQNEIK